MIFARKTNMLELFYTSFFERLTTYGKQMEYE
jgi:hypothetical protein